MKSGQDVAKMAFGLEKRGDVPNDVIPLESGYAVIQLKEGTPVAKKQSEEMADSFIQGLRMHKEARRAHRLLVEAPEAKMGAEIEIAPEFANEPKQKPGENGEDLAAGGYGRQ